MSNDKQQIEEMAKVLKDYTKKNNIMASHVILDAYAEELYKAGFCKQEWISVEDRLPEEDGTYITFTNAKGKSEGVIAQSLVTKTIRGNTIRRWEWQTRISPWVVTHWMPLPEAPKMKNTEN